MLFITGAFCVYALADASLSRGVAFWPAVYGLIILAFAVRLLSACTLKRSVPLDRISILFMASCLVFLLRTLSQRTAIPVYILGDCATVALPLLCYLVVRTSLSESHLRSLTRSIGIFSVFAYGLSPFIAESGLGREFAPPSIAAMTLPILFLLESKKWTGRIFWLLCTSLVCLLSFYCGQRTNVFVIAIAFILYGIPYFLKLHARSKVAILVSLPALFSAVLALYLLEHNAVGVTSLDFGRMGTVLDALKGEDDSIDHRGDEVADVLAFERSTAGIIFGEGFGATYTVKYSYPERNVYEGEVVHNIHFGPALVFHRYGVLGLIFLATICYCTLFVYIRAFFGFYSGQYFRRIDIYFSGVMIIYVISFCLRSVMTDPFFSFSLAVVLSQFRGRRNTATSN